jgi:multidrug efflux pump subunit AcrA (membrane-fusion protein)
MKLFGLTAGRREPSSDQLIRTFQSETGEMRAARGPVQARLTVLLLGAMFIILLVLAGSFRIDRVVESVSGQIVTREPSVMLQSPAHATVASIDVQEGDRVKAGQVLVTLEAAQPRGVVRVEAPEEAVVLRLAKLAVGSVLNEGEPFIELALLRSTMEAEIYVHPRDVGFLRPGDAATIKLEPYYFVEHGWAEGKVRWISQSSFASAPRALASAAATSPGSGADAATQLGAPLYKARITITAWKLRNVPEDARPLPGMPLAADIHVGTRSVFWYLASGIVRGFDEAMREP